MIDALLERNILPDFLIRYGIRRLLAQRLRDENKGSLEATQRHAMELLQALRQGPIAVQTREANEQHYEVPTAFYLSVLGKNLKYSSGYWDETASDLNASEDRMLALTCERAQLAQGQDILELGCGWGSLSLWMAQRYPQSRIMGVSNSRTQKEHIEKRCRDLGLTNLQIVTNDMNVFDVGRTFDRVVSVEMFEHMRNHEVLLRKIAGWLKPAGKLFVHIFTHRDYTYLFDPKDDTDWMSRYFFSGGMMPSDHYLLYFQQDLTLEKHWRVDGTHYAKTSEAWLKKMDANKAKLWPLFENTYPVGETQKWWAYWRVFFMSCAELWGYRHGREWFVSHYLFTKK